MSSFWSWFVIGLTVISLIATFWLIVWSGRQGPQDSNKVANTGHTWDGLTENNNPLPRWWLGLFILTIVWGVGYLIYYPGLGTFKGTSNWTQLGQYQTEIDAAEAKYAPLFAKYSALPVTQLLDEKDALAIGESLFANYCSTCHGSSGRGATGFPNLTDDDWLYGSDFAAIEHSIAHGRSGIMPPLAGAFPKDSQLQNMIDYVQTLVDTPDTSSAAHAQYQVLCSACHGPAGEGVQALGAPRLNDDIWLYGSTDSAIRRSITEGRNGVMPAHNKLLGDDRIRLIAAYVSSLSRASEQ